MYFWIFPGILLRIQFELIRLFCSSIRPYPSVRMQRTRSLPMKLVSRWATTPRIPSQIWTNNLSAICCRTAKAKLIAFNFYICLLPLSLRLLYRHLHLIRLQLLILSIKSCLDLISSFRNVFRPARENEVERNRRTKRRNERKHGYFVPVNNAYQRISI